MAEPLLSIRGLSLRDRRGRALLAGIDLDLHRGEVLGLIGESGAGKSTLGLAAMGYCRPGCRIDAGSVRFDGTELTTLPPARLRALHGTRIAYVAQSAAAAFNPAHRLLPQTLEPGLRHHRFERAEGTARAIDLFRRMRLPDPDHIGARFPHQVSGGQLQRAMTAMAMTCRPDLIIFDEPTTALDVTTQLEVLATIRQLVAETGTAALYISHDLAVVSQMAQRILVLKSGQPVEEAPTPQMLAAPRAPYTRSLWSVRHLEKTPVPDGPPLLECDGLTAAYGRLKVLHDIRLSVPQGAVVALVGESGSGKSTLARVLAGVLPQSAGQIRFRGQPLPPDRRQRDRDLLRRIQLIYQSAETALNPRQSLATLVGRPAALHGGLSGRALQARVAALLEQVGLPPARAGDRIACLSGGQRQRVAIARALAADPDLLICDEVTSALDQLVQKQILELLLELQRSLGKTFLFITHDIDTVRAIADHVVVMHRGRIVEQGPTPAVLNAPRDAYTRRLLASVPQMDAGWLSRRIAETDPAS
ncbi:nickel ABC transporter ATP-binding protein NikE [Pseudooceanicola sp. GBMRC 2024]|uniref:Nickel ABC transporter ATP-binding protein NikE n=1 Tax=Pseudooceanicola albus TaxID=2692189 RepID=A0A6L7G370_9RHOB|nr:ABC transporter ATP-binding protein [Pseudooceanicola albus]MXN17840.1 nickel ABC transporter ATP-binding protein NikE [Pseudooceanicola albus]